jgi:hypothetical protein
LRALNGHTRYLERLFGVRAHREPASIAVQQHLAAPLGGSKYLDALGARALPPEPLLDTLRCASRHNLHHAHARNRERLFRLLRTLQPLDGTLLRPAQCPEQCGYQQGGSHRVYPVLIK